MPHHSKPPTPMTRSDKKSYIRERASQQVGTGLELGPHIDPVIRKSQGDNVVYVETRSTEQLRQLCIKEGKDPERVEEIDFVFTGERSLKQLLGDRTFPWIVSSHVIEHIPDFVGHLQEIEILLELGGKYYAIVPDRNLCFDCLRPHSTLGDVLEAHLLPQQGAPLRTVIDDLRYSSKPEGVKVGGWTARVAQNKQLLPARPNRKAAIQAIIAEPASRNIRWTGHFWQFSPLSFYHLLADLRCLGLTSLAVIDILPTRNMDFIATLAIDPAAPIASTEIRSQLAAHDLTDLHLPVGDL